MFKTHKNGVHEYTLHAFTTAKGTFTLTGTSSDWIDTFKNLDTGEFHDWPRSHIKKWLDQGKITPVPEATRTDWHENQHRASKERAQSKVIRKLYIHTTENLKPLKRIKIGLNEKL